MNRRKFLKSAALSAATLAVAPRALLNAEPALQTVAFFQVSCPGINRLMVNGKVFEVVMDLETGKWIAEPFQRARRKTA